MKKTFLLLGLLALVAIGTNAQSFVQDLNLSEFSAWSSATYESATQELTVADEWGGGQIYYGTKDVTSYDRVVLTLSSASTADVYLTVYYPDDTPANHNITIAAGATSGTLFLKANTIEKIFITASAAATVQLSSLRLETPLTENLWSGTLTADNWINNQEIPASQLGMLSKGDKIIVNVTAKDDSNEWPGVNIYAANDWETSYANVGLTDVSTFPYQAVFTLTEAMVTAFKAGGLRIRGAAFTATSVDWRKHSLLWSGSQTMGSGWSEYVQIPAADLATLDAGDELCLRVTAASNGGVILLQDGDWTNFAPSVQYNFDADIDASTVITLPVSYLTAKKLEGKNLIVKGTNYTIDAIYFKEKEVVTSQTVTLTVSAAGLATWVLPFDAELPDGVRAFTLAYAGEDKIECTEVDVITANQPVLIEAEAGTYDFTSADNAVVTYASTPAEGALIGTYYDLSPLVANVGDNYNYVLANGAAGVAFYPVGDNVSVAPFHAYLQCTYNSAATPSAAMRLVFHRTPTDVEHAVESENAEVRKVIRDGQIVIIRNGEEYNIAGQIIK